MQTAGVHCAGQAPKRCTAARCIFFGSRAALRRSTPRAVKMLGANELPLRQGFRLAAKTLVRRIRGGSLTLAGYPGIYSVLQSQEKSLAPSGCKAFLFTLYSKNSVDDRQEMGGKGCRLEQRQVIVEAVDVNANLKL